MHRNRYTVRDVAQFVGLNPWTLRRLERLGRIPAPPRDAISGWRYYTDHDLEQVRAALTRLERERTATTA